MHPFDAPCRRAPPSYCTDAGLCQALLRGAYWHEKGFGSCANGELTLVSRTGQTMTGPHLLIWSLQIVRSVHSFTLPLHRSYTGNFHMIGRPFGTYLPAINLLVRVAQLTTDAHTPEQENLRHICTDYLKPHTH
ncbi:hypothetical protein O181_011919 [Austropuccinia psidii MF-1]|uniref:Uncharacterized protein n=1 Tax=Austropuccinia psidii MF-1 TaxID=1389203 RepID=A0A9Q3BVD8_9BASI|nr:hypothetical protein [Austropuccinia psidii MF-1]